MRWAHQETPILWKSKKNCSVKQRFQVHNRLRSRRNFEKIKKNVKLSNFSDFFSRQQMLAEPTEKRLYSERVRKITSENSDFKYIIGCKVGEILKKWKKIEKFLFFFQDNQTFWTKAWNDGYMDKRHIIRNCLRLFYLSKS